MGPTYTHAHIHTHMRTHTVADARTQGSLGSPAWHQTGCHWPIHCWRSSWCWPHVLVYALSNLLCVCVPRVYMSSLSVQTLLRLLSRSLCLLYQWYNFIFLPLPATIIFVRFSSNMACQAHLRSHPGHKCVFGSVCERPTTCESRGDRLAWSQGPEAPQHVRICTSDACSQQPERAYQGCATQRCWQIPHLSEQTHYWKQFLNCDGFHRVECAE